MAAGRSFFARLQHRDPAVRAAAGETLLAVVTRLGGDLRGAAAELGVSMRTVRKWLAAAPAADGPTATRGVRAPPGDGIRTAATDPHPATPPLRFPARAARSPFGDFALWHRSPLGAQQPQPRGEASTAHAREPMAPQPRRLAATEIAGERAARGAIPRPAAAARTSLPRAGAAAAPALLATDAGEWPHRQPETLPREAAAIAPGPGQRRLAFVLHAHLPWVLGHGRWPHGEDWLAEAIAHCYLPLVLALRRLAARGGRHLLTVSVSPVLAAQLVDARTAPLASGYLEHRRAAARDLAARHPLARFWEATYDDLLAGWQQLDGDLVGALGALAADGVVELSTCAATHGYLPLLHRREHVTLQVATALHNHRRWFGTAPIGFWMPECAYRPAGPWRHPATGASEPSRPGNEDFLAPAGVRWTVVDAHLMLGGEPLVPYPELWGAGTDGGEGSQLPLVARLQPQRIGSSAVTALPREPHSAHQVWSRQGGYPGDPRYLDFHKRHAESGLRLWSVTDAGGDLGDKLPYHPAEARAALRDQAEHFHQLLAGLAGGVAVCPYDAELFGHWWFEGVAWLEEVLARSLEVASAVLPTTPGRELATHPPAARGALHEGSWGEAGDHRVWVNEETAWMWEDLRLAEEAVAATLPGLARHRGRAALAQLMLLAASDWPFLVHAGTAADYASERFRRHRDRLHELLTCGKSDPLPAWAAEDLAGIEIDPAWWDGHMGEA